MPQWPILTRKISFDGTILVNYSYLADGKKDTQKIRKDAIMPDGTMVIIKPDTPTCHTAAERRIKLLKENFENPKFSTIFYDPTDIKYLPGSPTYIGPNTRY